MTVKTVTDLVAAFGGNRAMAEWADVGDSAVCNWKDSNAIPRGYHLRLYLEAKKRGIAVDAEAIFGIAPDQLFGDAPNPRPRPKPRTEAAA